MDRTVVVEWLNAYVQAWETGSAEAICNLFTNEATYTFHPYDEPVVGRQAIVDSWLKDPDVPGTFEATYQPIAIDGDVTVVNGRSRYFKDSSRRELTKEWDNIFVIEFDKERKCSSFREWYVPRRGQAD